MIIKLGLVGCVWVACAVSMAQVPDVSVKLDAALTYRSAENAGSTLQTYNTLARPSYVSLILRMDQGFNAVFSERFERIKGDGDTEHLLEYYVEDPGNWRLGKQLLPFGGGSLVRMYARAAKGNTEMPFIYYPLQMVIFDDGPGKSRGAMTRIGGKLGLSVAFGRNLGIQSGVLGPLKSPEESLGKYRGYQQLYGLDFSKRLGIWKVQTEAVVLREGEKLEDRNSEATDLVFTYEPNSQQSLSFGWGRDWGEGFDMYRIEGRLKLARNLWFEPILRYRDGVFYDLGLSVRVKL